MQRMSLEHVVIKYVDALLEFDRTLVVLSELNPKPEVFISLVEKELRRRGVREQKIRDILAGMRSQGK